MKFTAMTAMAALLLSVPAMTLADPDDDTLIINDETEVITETTAPAHIADVLDTIYSGWRFREDETQALQMDDFDNPGMVFVDLGLDQWNKVEGEAGQSCASCHGDVEESMKGVRAVYPKWNEAAQEVRTLAMQINDCRETNMKAEPYKYTSNEMTNMEALISVQSRGLPVDVAIDGPVQATWEAGKEMYYTRYGQLELSCANCHEQNWGNMIRADHLSQGHVNGFPTYRLKNAKLNQTHDRFQGCIRDTRGHTYAPGSPEFVALELYVASRGNGLAVEGPSVRN